MLTRLRVQGFKSLADVDIRFGPFTCIAGANGVGKSNLFDALGFLRDLTLYEIGEAASRVRDPEGKAGSLQSIFTQTEKGHADTLRFEADLIVPSEVTDDYGRKAEAKITYLEYQLELKYRPATDIQSDRLELVHESLTYVALGDAKQRLGFPHSKEFRTSVVSGRSTTALISTVEDERQMVSIKLHQDGRGGPPFKVSARQTPRTVLGGINTDTYPTALAARREMQSWMFLQLEPSALRQPDSYAADAHLTASGAHMPATLRRLEAKQAIISNRLAELLEVRRVEVQADPMRRLYTVMLLNRNGVAMPARALSDGTLRFLALSIICEDVESGRLIALEEPENGIHPARIPAMLELLEDMAADSSLPVDADNPLRQVIINTHSPAVVAALPAESLVVSGSVKRGGSAFTIFECIADSWRGTKVSPPMPSTTLGMLGDYLEKPGTTVEHPPSTTQSSAVKNPKTVRQYYDEQQLQFRFDKMGNGA